MKNPAQLRRIFFVIIFTNTATFFCLHSFGCRNTTALQTPTITNNVSIGACRAVTPWQPHTVAAAHRGSRPNPPKKATLKNEGRIFEKNHQNTCGKQKKLFIFAAQSVDGRNMVARLLVSRLRVRLPSPIQKRDFGPVFYCSQINRYCIGLFRLSGYFWLAEPAD
jgi:hypothetical protein